MLGRECNFGLKGASSGASKCLNLQPKNYLGVCFYTTLKNKRPGLFPRHLHELLNTEPKLLLAIRQPQSHGTLFCLFGTYH